MPLTSEHRTLVGKEKKSKKKYFILLGCEKVLFEQMDCLRGVLELNHLLMANNVIILKHCKNT